MEKTDKPDGWEPDVHETPALIGPRNVYQALGAAMLMIEPVAKSRTAPGVIGGFPYRGIDEIMNSVHDALATSGIITSVATIQASLTFTDIKSAAGKVETLIRGLATVTFYGPQGDSLVIGPVLAEGMDGRDKGAAKFHTGALKTALLQTFIIPTAELAAAHGLRDQERDEPTPQERPERRPDPAASRGTPTSPTMTTRREIPEQTPLPTAPTGAPPRGEPAANRAAWDAQQSRINSPSTKSNGLEAMRERARNLVLEYLAGEPEATRFHTAGVFLQTALPHVKTSDDMTALDCRRIELALLMLPRVPGNTLAAVGEFLDKQWVMSPLAKLTDGELTAAFAKLAEPPPALNGKAMADFDAKPLF